MNKKTALENLLFDSGLKIGEFAEKVGVNVSTFRSQLYNSKESHIDLAFKYGRILGVDTIKGYVDGCTFELVVGKKQLIKEATKID